MDGGVRIVRHAAAAVALDHVAAARLAGAERLPQALQLGALGAVVDQDVHVDTPLVRRDQPVGRRLLAEQIHRHGDRLTTRSACRAAGDGADRLVENGLGAPLGRLAAGGVVEHHPGLRRVRRRFRRRHQIHAHQCRTADCGDQRDQQSLHRPVLISRLPWEWLRHSNSRVSLTIVRLWRAGRRRAGCCAPGTGQPRLSLPHVRSIGAMPSAFLRRHTIISRMASRQAVHSNQTHTRCAERETVARGRLSMRSSRVPHRPRSLWNCDLLLPHQDGSTEITRKAMADVGWVAAQVR